MPNKQLFKKAPKGKLAPVADTINNAGGTAYELTDEAALATLACTGTMHNTFYVDAGKQFSDVMELCQRVSPEFIAKTAVYARQKGYMKDLPCLLLAILLTKDTVLFKKAFHKVIDNVKMLRSFVQILRSGVVGRKSLGSCASKCIKEWFNGWEDANKLFNSSIGSDPSLGDIIRLAHPRPKNDEFSALFAYLCGFPYDAEKLPESVQRYELLKRNYAEGVSWDTLPDINFQYLTSVKLTKNNWINIAGNASWQTTRMNLNTFQRHGVFEDANHVGAVAQRLKDPNEIAKSKVFPYTLLSAYKMTQGVPHNIREALQDAMEVSIQNVPKINGKVIVAIDSSGSMSSPVTGYRGSATTTVSCSDVAGLVGAAIKRNNPEATIISFDTAARLEDINPRDSVMTNARRLSRGGGGTAVSTCIKLANDQNIRGDLFIIVSDNESWFDSNRSAWSNESKFSGTSAQIEWNRFKVSNPNAKLICIDITPNKTTQCKEAEDVVNVAGFSDQVFNLIADVASGAGKDHFVNTISAVAI